MQAATKAFMDSIKSQIDFVSGRAIRSGFQPGMEHEAPVALISKRSEPKSQARTTRLKLVSPFMSEGWD